MKKFLNILIIIVFILLCKTIFDFCSNEKLINEYHNNNYDSNLSERLLKLNLHEPYVYNYNNCNIKYKKEQYNEAVNCYKEVLTHIIPSNRICDVRVNLALSLLKTINDNNKEQIKQEALNVLYTNDCAKKGIEDRSGRDEKSEDLEEEILKEETESGGEGKEENEENKGEEEKEKEKEEQEKKQQEIEEKNKKGRKDRQQQENGEPNYSHSEQFW